MREAPVQIRSATRGFTAIEIMVVIAAVAILAGILVPIVSNTLERSKIDAARAELSTLEQAILAYARDVGFRPGNPPDAGVALGAFPRADTGGGAFTSILSDDLVTRNPNDPPWDPSRQEGWNGPYVERGETVTVDADNDGDLEDVSRWRIDPWNHYYIYTNTDPGGQPVDENDTTRWVIVLSAGPDGVPFTSDDIERIVYSGPIY
jgi:prepilin-type N-terminal cleavage/methylation domain-containing protein